MSSLPRIEHVQQRSNDFSLVQSLLQPVRGNARKADASRGRKSNRKGGELNKVVAQIRIDEWELANVTPAAQAPTPPPPGSTDGTSGRIRRRKSKVAREEEGEPGEKSEAYQQDEDRENSDDSSMEIVTATSARIVVPLVEIDTIPLAVDTSEHEVFLDGVGSNSGGGGSYVTSNNDDNRRTLRNNCINFRKIPYDQFMSQSSKQKSGDPGNEKKMSVSSPKKILGFYKLLPGKIKLVSKILENHGLKQTKDDVNFVLLWSTQHLKPHFYQSLRVNQKVNLFPLSHECTRKDSLSRNINRMAEMHGKRHFAFMPDCYVWPSEKMMLEEAMNKGSVGPWIVKPAGMCTTFVKSISFILHVTLHTSVSDCEHIGSSQGKGIYIASNIRELPQRRTEREDNWVVERYIQNPLLLDGYKFDLRIYVAVTSFTPLRIYIHKEGLVRLSSEKYSYNKEDYNDRFRHLTNYSVNKANCDSSDVNKDNSDISNDNGSAVDDHDDGIDYCNRGSKTGSRNLKLSFTQLREKFTQMGYNNIVIWEKIHDLIIKTLISVEPKIKGVSKRFIKSGEDACFELFGFDVLLDDELNPYLMEVNFSPSLNTDSKLDFDVKNSVLVDLFNMVKISPYVAAKQGAVSLVKSVYQSSDFLACLRNNSSPRNRQKKFVKQSSSPKKSPASNLERLLNSNVVKERLIAPAKSPTAEGELDSKTNAEDEVTESVDGSDYKEMESFNKLSPTSPPSSDSPVSPTSCLYERRRTTMGSDDNSNTLWTLNKKQRMHIAKLQHEIKRGGSFQCIFPTSSSYKYFSFFEEVSEDLAFICEYLYKVEGNATNRWRLLSNKGEIIKPTSVHTLNSGTEGNVFDASGGKSQRNSKTLTTALPTDFKF